MKSWTVPTLAWRNLRHRVGAGILLILALSAATTTFSLALSVGEAATAPWERTFVQTRGAHVVADAANREVVADLARAREVVSVGGPWPLVVARGRVNGHDIAFRFIGRDSLGGEVERPVVTSGTSSLERGIVLERSFADSLGVQVGDIVTTGDLPLPVTGIAVSVAQPPFPATAPGLAWVSSDTVDRLATAADLQGYQVQLRLAQPEDAHAFVARHSADGAVYSTWQDTRATTLAEVKTTRVVLLTVSVLLALLTTASVAVVVATSMSARVRQVGVLKAVGLTPRQVTAVVLLEHLVLAAIAVVLGLVAGAFLAPALARPGTSLLGGEDAPAPGWLDVVVVAVTAAAVVAVATVRPALRAARSSTVRALGSLARQPRPAGVLGRFAASLPLPLGSALGVRALGRRPARAMLAAGTVGLSITMVVAALAMERTFQIEAATAPTETMPGPQPIDPALLDSLNAAADDRLRSLVYVFAALFVVLGAINVIIVAAFLARDQVRNHAVLRAVGFTRRQTAASIATSQALSALAGCALGVPLGLLVFRFAYAAANGSGEGASLPPPLWLLPLPLVVAVIAAALAAVPARMLARHSPASILAHD